MSTILLCGDAHGTFSHVTSYVQSLPVSDQPAGVIFVGDLDPQRPLHEEFRPLHDLLGPDSVKFIFGNHECDSEVVFNNMWSSPAFQEHCIHGKVIEISGIRVAGFGGVFRGEIFYPRDSSNAKATGPQFRNYLEYKKWLLSKMPGHLKRELSNMDAIKMQAVPSHTGNMDLLDASRNGKLRKHMCSIFPDEYDKLADMRCDILVTHEAPGPPCHPNGFEEISLLAQSMGARVSFHGHHHDSLTYPTIGNWQPHGVGLRGISSLDLDTFEVTRVVPGELDDHRMFRQERME